MTFDEVYQAAMARIDRDRMRQIEAEFPNHTLAKFFDVEKYVGLAVQKAFDLGLSCTAHRRMLDVGGGFGYLALVADVLGHRAFCLDVPGKLFDAVKQTVGAEFIPYVVRSRMSIHMPGDREWGEIPPFDLITIVGVNFRDGSIWWGLDDYKFLFADLLTRLNPGGVIHVEWNRGDETNWLGPAKWDCGHESNGNVIRIFK